MVSPPQKIIYSWKTAVYINPRLLTSLCEFSEQTTECQEEKLKSKLENQKNTMKM